MISAAEFVLQLQDGQYNSRALMGTIVVTIAQDPGTEPTRRVWSSINVGLQYNSHLFIYLLLLLF